MRDLKHLIYFENLLQEANNDLVKQAKSDGKLALGYTCYFMPEVLLDLPGCFSVRLRAPRCTCTRYAPPRYVSRARSASPAASGNRVRRPSSAPCGRRGRSWASRRAP